MPKLVVNPGTAEAFELDLKSGVNSLGRSAENDFPIEHESISARHCEVLVAGQETTVFDLESVNGTFVGEVRVQQAVLNNGQSLRLGDVMLTFEQGTIAPPQPASGPAAVAAALGNTFCRYHPKSLAKYFCNKCAKAYCETCVGTWTVDGKHAARCRTCGSACTELALSAEEPKVLHFREVFAGAFKYPLQGDGFVLLAAGTLFYLFLSKLEYLAGFAGPYGIVVALIIAVFGAGYMVAYMKGVVVTSAAGEDRMPDWPDFSNWQEDIVAPLLQMLGILAFCFWPVALCAGLAATGKEALAPFVLPALLLGLIYLPMALLGVFLGDSMSGLSPVFALASIAKLRGQYWATCAIMAVVFAIYIGLQWVLNLVLPIPIIPGILSGFAGLYFLTVELRVLGLMYFVNKQRLAWF